MDHGLAVRAAGLLVFLLAGGALNKQQITGFVGAIHMGICRLTTLVAVRDNVVGNVLAQALVEDKVLAAEPVWQVLFGDLARVVNDAAVELVYVLEAVVLEVGRGFLAANASGTVEQQWLVLLAFELVENLRELLAEGLGFRQDGAFEVANFGLVVVAHIDQNGLTRIHQRIPFRRVQMTAHIGHVVVVHGQAIRYDLAPHLDGQLVEGLAVVLHCNLEGDIFKFFPGVEFRDKLLPMVFRHTHLRIDSFLSDVNAAKALQGIPL